MLTWRDPFWQASSVVLRYKRQIGLALTGAVISALCFGGGLGMLLPTLQLLLGQKQPLRDLIEQSMGSPDSPLWMRDLAAWLAPQVPTDPFRAFLLVMAMIATLTVIGSTGRYLHELQTLTVVARSGVYWRSRLLGRLIQARLDHLLLNGYADSISRITHDVTLLCRGFSTVMGKAASKILNGLVGVAVAVCLDWRLTLIALVGTPVIAVLMRKFGKRIRRATKRLMSQRGRMIAMLNEALGGIRVVKVHHGEGYERRRFARLNRAVYSEEMRVRKVRAISSPVVESLGLFGVMLVASIAAWYVLHEDVAPERFMTVLAALGASAASLKPISNLNNELQESSAAATRVIEAMQIPVEPTGVEARSKPVLPRHQRRVAFESVWFSYPGQDTPALRDVSLTVQHGQTVAIVGSNGSGKTTLLSLIPRLIEPAQGRVLIDGYDIAEVNLRTLRRQIAVVTQQTVLFEGTIAANIAYSRGHERIDQIVAAAKAAYAHEFILELPQGYDTKLSEGGEGLSGGQKQRLCIARAVLRKPAVLILDEATSQIDADSEAKINLALRDITRDCTVFIIAHRLSTVVDADMIVVMSDGQIVDQGTHPQLLERCQPYRTLTQTQLQLTPA